MIEIGRVCVKLAGRDAGKKCVIIEQIDNNFVMIDGETRRRKCNIGHLHVLDQKADIKAKASPADVIAACKKLGMTIVEAKPKKAAPRTLAVRKSSKGAVAEAKAQPAPKKAAAAKPKNA